MKKVSMFLMLSASLFIVSFSGCGGSESSVVQPPTEEESAPAMGEIDEDEYNKAMNNPTE